MGAIVAVQAARLAGFLGRSKPQIPEARWRGYATPALFAWGCSRFPAGGCCSKHAVPLTGARGPSTRPYWQKKKDRPGVGRSTSVQTCEKKALLVSICARHRNKVRDNDPMPRHRSPCEEADRSSISDLLCTPKLSEFGRETSQERCISYGEQQGGQRHRLQPHYQRAG